jgi:glutamine amidotransferase
VTRPRVDAGACRIAVADYGAGNLVSIVHALEHVGARVDIARTTTDLDGAAAVVVPGVGASGPAMRSLERTGLARGIEQRVARGAWYLGICLGMQLLFDTSDEDGATCLGWIPGRVAAIPDAPRLPHVGWNAVELVRPHPLLPRQGNSSPGVTSSAYYFVHGYAAFPADRSVVVAETTHGGRFPSVVAHDRLLGVQFHPEKSGEQGLDLLRAFLALVASEAPVPANGAVPAERAEPASAAGAGAC